MCGSCLLRFTKNNKALSPVVASIILIAVVVAVSIAATTWMGSISFNFMEVDDLRITAYSWASDTSYIDLTIKNLGTSSVTISEVEVNDVTASDASFVSGDETLEAGETAIVRVTQSFMPPKKYEFTIITASGTKFAYIAVASSTGTSKIWYNPSWIKRKAVTIDNTLNPNALTDYQVWVTVGYDSDMIADFSDLRFTDSDGQTLIPYWVESYVPSDSAVVWVKVPAISASSTTTIYMYYGNPSAPSESNPDDTFDVFVDFTRDGVISYGGSSQDVDSAQWEIIDDTILRMWGNNWKATMKTLTVAGDGSQAICFDFKSSGIQAEINGVGVDTDNSISESRFYRIYGTQDWGINDHYGYTGAGDWQSYTIVLDNFSGDFNRFVFTNDADSGQATDIYYMNVRVSQYTSQAPSTELGAEETM
jgi:flagellin-like protein